MKQSILKTQDEPLSLSEESFTEQSNTRVEYLMHTGDFFWVPDFANKIREFCPSEDFISVNTAVLQAYDRFISRLEDAITSSFTEQDDYAYSYLPIEHLEEPYRELFKSTEAIITLDPTFYHHYADYCPNTPVHLLSYSRVYSPDTGTWSGRVLQDHDPDRTLSRIAQELEGKHVTLVDDETYSGGSFKAVIEALSHHGTTIAACFSTLNVGKIREIAGLPLQQAVLLERGSPDEIETLHARDFLLGVSGAVTLSTTGVTRVPYCLPFFDPSKRLSIAQETSSKFSIKILLANKSFYQELNEHFSIEIPSNAVPYGRQLQRTCGSRSMLSNIESHLNYILANQL
jgi:hypothetical protein